MHNKISVVIPCYYSEKTIKPVISRVVKTIQQDNKYDYEIICVNDGSTDGTYLMLKELAKDNPLIKIIDLSKNFGQHCAIMAGLNYITGDIVVCLDDDGENPPEEMFRLIEKLEEGYDVVSVIYKKEQRNWIRKIGTRVSMATSHALIGMPPNIEINSYFAMKSFIAKEMIKYTNSYPFIAGLMLRITRNIGNVEIKRGARIAGTSNYNFSKLLRLWLNGFTAFSEKPLQIASIVGLLSSGIGILYAIAIIVQKIIGDITVSGYSSIMAAILIFSGFIMFFLGLLGEYIGRIYICINNAPQFAIRETVNTEKEE